MAAESRRYYPNFFARYSVTSTPELNTFLVDFPNRVGAFQKPEAFLNSGFNRTVTVALLQHPGGLTADELHSVVRQHILDEESQMDSFRYDHERDFSGNLHHLEVIGITQKSQDDRYMLTDVGQKLVKEAKAIIREMTEPRLEYVEFLTS